MDVAEERRMTEKLKEQAKDWFAQRGGSYPVKGNSRSDVNRSGDVIVRKKSSRK